MMNKQLNQILRKLKIRIMRQTKIYLKTKLQVTYAESFYLVKYGLSIFTSKILSNDNKKLVFQEKWFVVAF